jgi:uncharacterized protein (DUF3084 family)
MDNSYLDQAIKLADAVYDLKSATKQVRLARNEVGDAVLQLEAAEKEEEKAKSTFWALLNELKED